MQGDHKETHSHNQFVDIEKAYDDDEGLFAERKACGKMYTFYCLSPFSLNTRISCSLPLRHLLFIFESVESIINRMVLK